MQALREVSLELHRREVVGLIGPNGAGKSTLVNLLSGFDRPTGGAIELEGRDVTRWPAHRRGRAGLARTFQHAHAFPALSVRENVEIAALGVGARRREAVARAGRLLDLLGLSRYADTAAASLAHGDERRLGVARALATDPRFVLLDEPAAGLPEAEVPDFAAAVRSVRDEHGAGVLLIDHNMALVMDVCDRVVVLDQGMTLAEGTPAEIRANLDVAAAYLGESAVQAENERARRRRPRGSLRRGPCRARALARGRARRARRADRAERRRQVVDAPRDHGRGAGELGRRATRRPLARRAPHEDVARAGIALVPEGRRIFAELTVEENLRLGLAGRRGRGGGFERVYELFPVVREFRRRSAGALSGGQQQQLAIARALVAEPDVLLLDEPSLGLAPRIVDVVFEALGAIRESGIAVLLVEQRAQRTVALADRTYVIANGELRLTLGPADAGDTDRLVAAYLA